MIYFAQTPTGSIKIGFTDDLEARMGQLAINYGAELSLLATLPGDRDRETEIHERFARLRFGKTEQFRPGPELMSFIGKPLLVGINPDAVEAAPGRPCNAITIRGSSEWKTWLEDFAARMRSKPTAIIDLALAKLAHQEGFREPPARI